MAIMTRHQNLLDIQRWEYWDNIQIGAHKEYGMSKEEFDELLPEYQKFMGLIAQGYTRLGMFGSSIDKLWHAHILNTVLYEHFCMKIHGKMIHHVIISQGRVDCISKTPCGGGSEEVDPNALLEYFREAYKEVYGQFPGDIWSLPEPGEAAIAME